MRPSSRRCVLGLTTSLVIAALSSAIAQEQSHAAKGRETRLISTVLTGKERLGRKWMDVEVITAFAARSGRPHCCSIRETQEIVGKETE